MELEDVSYQFLQEITDGFSDERVLGEGAFAVVYKGLTKNGDDVAVKKLKLHNVNLDLKQFQNEFYNLTKLKHQNVVQIHGYCYETEEKPFILPDGSKVSVDDIHIALCFEYLHNGSLQKHLSDDFYKLDWHTRFKIIKGICEGLKYIHDELEEPIYHLDLKPDNILLDKDMVPKIADFGLSRIFGNEMPRTTRNPYGTLGYQPPEYIEKGEISGKFDIFSLGVLIIKIVSGSKGYYPKHLDMSSDELIDEVRNIDQVHKDWRNCLKATCSGDCLLDAYCHQVKTCTQIALSCGEPDSNRRPDIVKITEKLKEIEIDVGVLPEKGCHRTVSRMTMHNSKIEMITQSMDITHQHQNIILRSDPSCNELELYDALETSSDIVEEHIVGRTEEKEKVKASLLEAMSGKMAILPIHGIGGIGKTTFARLIYNDPMFKCYSHVWVDVSHRFDLNKIGESIISQLSKKEIQANERKMIHCSLTELLSGKKILIVLDDLWEDNQFQLQELKDMLYHDDSNIIIFVTTRSEHVAERICTNLQPYKILPLTNDMCWDIIKQRSGFEDRDDKEQLKGIGLAIARKCGGVALAAESLGFTLQSMNFDQWMKVKDSDIWNEHVSNVFSLPNHVLASLMLSYSYMPPCLKPCFTYCATFPKGHNIVKDDLIYQWIALDFIKPTKLLSNMELCERYIVQLLGLSFFQQPVSPKTSKAYYKQATFFTMHDLVHDLAISLLGNKILDQSKQGNTSGSSCKYALLRDCSRPLELCLTSHERLKALRFLEGRRSELSGAAFAPARSLRVLDLSKCSIKRLPDSIGQLKQLRYLIAPEIQDEIVPECITELSNLIYLNLQGSNISTLPESIGELEKLMHLDISNCRKIHELPVSFRNLEKLVHLDLSHCSRITGVSESLQSLSRLEHLNLSSCHYNGDQARAMSGLTGLQYLNLSFVPCVGLQQVLLNLTKLRYLNLKGGLHSLDKAEKDNLLECVCSLSDLEYLNLSCNPDLRSIPESIGNLIKLNTLDLRFCFNLERLPASISAINSLKFLLLTDCSELDISRLENVKSAEEAKRIKLAEKQSIKVLELAWTRDAKRFADDREVLSELVPPDTLETLTLQGYSSISFPSWMMSIAIYLPRLSDVILRDLPSCNVLPPLGQLPNLESLRIGGMDSIRKIDGGFYGCRSAFPRLLEFAISRMECLEEWNAEDGLNELAFPKLQRLSINHCPLLRFKACWSPAMHVTIDSSDQILLSTWEDRDHVSASSSTATTWLHVKCCEVPLHQWSLLRHLPYLEDLKITDCSDLTCISTNLPSLKILTVKDCKNGIVALQERMADDREVLSELVAPDTIETLTLNGYNSISSPSWMMSIATYLPRLEYVTLKDLPGCDVLPPLGQLPNLKWLQIHGMGSIRKIDGGFYGGRNAFPRLREFDISRMECLEEWNAEDGLNELAFPELRWLSINRCPLLRFKVCWPPAMHVTIDSSDQILLSSWENRDHVSASSSMATTSLHVKCCEVPLHQWSLLRHLPCLEDLKITDCSDLTCISTDFCNILTVKYCKNGIVSLLERLGDLTSLTQLVLRDCSGIKSLAESIQQLRSLRRLVIRDCPELVQWCKSEENKIKLAHIREIIFDFESLTAKDEKSSASEAGHDATALEDLPVQQFSLGSSIGPTTTPGRPGTSRTERRRKPTAKPILRKGGTTRPCRGSLLAVPQTLPIAGPSTTDIGVFGSSASTHLTSLQCPELPPTTPGSMYTFAATARPKRSRWKRKARTKDETKQMEKNKDAVTRKMEDLENTTRDAIDIDMSHPTRLLSRDPGSSKENYDESKYECEASKQQREVLELSRDFESLTANDEKSGASEASQDASALEDLPAQQFSLGCWISSTTMPGTSRSTQRRRKPVAELIRRNGGRGTARPCHGSLLTAPRTPPVAGPSTTDIGVFGSSASTHLTSLQCLALQPTTSGSMYTFTATARPHLPLQSTARTKDENEADGEGIERCF